MGVFAKVVLYRTDGGQVMGVEDMDTSHLLNAIHHHNKQIKTCEFVKETIVLSKKSVDNLTRRVDDLVNTVTILAAELVKRDPADDEARFPETHLQEGYSW